MTTEAPTRDGKSGLRKVFEVPCYVAMYGIDSLVNRNPNNRLLTPDKMTEGRVWINLGLTFLEQQGHIFGYNFTPEEVKWLGITKVLAYLADKLDGSEADVFDRKYPGSHDRARGQILDTRMDRLEEAGMALLRARTAFLRGDLYGEFAAYGAALTCILPSMERARFETTGHGKVKETGNNLIQAAGARIGRPILGEIAGYSQKLQPWVDLASTGANINTALARRKLYDKYKNIPLQALSKKEEQERCQTIEFSKKRLHDLEKTQLLIAVATFATPVLLRSLPTKDVRIDDPIDFMKKAYQMRKAIILSQSKAA